MTPSSKKPNPKLSEATELVESMFKGGNASPYIFRELIQLLLSHTIMKAGESIIVHGDGVNNNFLISGRKRDKPDLEAADGREFLRPIQLNDGRYMHLSYECFLDKDDYLKIATSKISYQLEAKGHKQIFRFDYDRLTPNHYPSAHVHIYGTWQQKEVEDQKGLAKVHIPVLRNTIESFIRMIVNEFNTPTNESDPDVWRETLRHTEKEFLRVARTTRTEASKPE